jgi:hypothetical protein
VDLKPQTQSTYQRNQVTVRSIQHLAFDVKQGQLSEQDIKEHYGDEGWDRVQALLQSEMHELHLPLMQQAA